MAAFPGDAGRYDYARLLVLAEHAAQVSRYVLYSSADDPRT
jgi:hypothetical protein